VHIKRSTHKIKSNTNLRIGRYAYSYGEFEHICSGQLLKCPEQLRFGLLTPLILFSVHVQTVKGTSWTSLSGQHDVTKTAIDTQCKVCILLSELRYFEIYELHMRNSVLLVIHEVSLHWTCR